MSFWQSKTGEPITGNEGDSFVSYFASIPDNTQADAVIKAFEPREYNESKNYQVIWSICSGDFSGCLVKQTINPFDQDAAKSQRALNMMMRFYKLTDYKPTHNNAPSKEDLLPMIGKKFSIKIGNGIIQGKDKTWVREIHAADKLEVKTGHTNVTTGFPDSALSRNSRVADDVSVDIPF